MILIDKKLARYSQCLGLREIKNLSKQQTMGSQMTTDHIQEKQLRWKASITDASHFKVDTRKEKRIELTKMENFLEGRYDIFDVLENHAANRQMKIKTDRLLADRLKEEDLAETPLFKTLWDKLKSQMNNIVL